MDLLNVTQSTNKINQFLEPFYSKIIITLLILLIGLIAGKIIGKLLEKLLNEIEINHIIKKATGFNVKLDKIVSLTVSYFIYFVAIMWALENIGLSSIIINVLAGGVIILFVVAIILGIKDFIPNIIAGIFIHFKKIIKENDNIEIDNLKGRVEQISLIETKLITRSKDIIYVPNSIFIKSQKIKILKK
ncbi:MAG: mechanosensitive ion channel domain-containing protein [Nanoarchaeota archaeon]